MSEPLNDGGPAFPGDDGWTDRGTHYHGMTLRDWFAGMALQGIHASYTEGYPSPENAAIEAYRASDAMLKQREQKP